MYLQLGILLDLVNLGRDGLCHLVHLLLIEIMFNLEPARILPQPIRNAPRITIQPIQQLAQTPDDIFTIADVLVEFGLVEKKLGLS